MSSSAFELSRALLKASDAWSRLVERFLQERFELSYAQFTVLEALLDSPGIRQGELAQKLGKSKGNMTGLVGRLEAAGLVNRQGVEGDARAYSLELTRKGYMVTLVIHELNQFTHGLLGHIPPQERTLLATTLTRLAAIFDRAETDELTLEQIEKKGALWAEEAVEEGQKEIKAVAAREDLDRGEAILFVEEPRQTLVLEEELPSFFVAPRVLQKEMVRYLATGGPLYWD
ncbi:MAG: MarR family transcriptional regulator [Bacillota bacterium]|nr:MarR family transcriptional regulator [Bacillota bacterium]